MPQNKPKVPITSDDSWLMKSWRELMAFQYLVVCIADFLVFPILQALYDFYTNTPYTAWDPLTLKEGGFYHLAMGAIVGVSAYTKGNRWKYIHKDDSDEEESTT